MNRRSLVAAGFASLILAACGTPTLSPTAVPTVVIPTLVPTPIVIPTLPPTPAPELSTGGVSFPEAQVLITSCVNHRGQPYAGADGAVGTVVTLSGTITNTDTQADDYIVSIGTQAGTLGAGIGDDLSFTNLAVRATQRWSDRGYVTNALSQQVTCSVIDVEAEPA